jgi:hypothetical protein
MEENKLILARDVVFDEASFPYKHQTEHVPYSDQPPIDVDDSAEGDADSEYSPESSDDDGDSSDHSATDGDQPGDQPSDEVRNPTQPPLSPLSIPANIELPSAHEHKDADVPGSDRTRSLPNELRSVPGSVLRRSSRSNKNVPPERLAYAVNQGAGGVKHNQKSVNEPITDAPISDADPATFAQAMARPDSKEWAEAADREIKAMHDNGTWTLTELPQNRKLIRTTWVFKRKYNPDGSIEKYKARLCAKGFTQVQGVDYTDTFSPVPQPSSLRVVLAVATQLGLSLHQYDVESAFLNGKLDEELYMAQPEGFDDGSGRVCKLSKAIYGLKQASRVWNEEINKTLINSGYTRLAADPCVYVKRGADSQLAILTIWVDDILIATNSPGNG